MKVKNNTTLFRFIKNTALMCVLVSILSGCDITFQPVAPDNPSAEAETQKPALPAENPPDTPKSAQNETAAGNPPNTPAPKAEDEPATAEDADENGFKIYENEQYGFKIQYPSKWMLIDSSLEPAESFRAQGMTDEDIEAMFENLAEANNIDASTVSAYLFEMVKEVEALGGICALWFDYDSTEKTFISANYLYITEGLDISPDDLMTRANRRDIMKIFMQNIKDSYDNVEIARDSAGKYIGDNYYAYFAVNTTRDDEDFFVYNALTVHDDYLYVFVFSSPLDKAASYIGVYEELLSTLEFTQ